MKEGLCSVIMFFFMTAVCLGISSLCHWVN